MTWLEQQRLKKIEKEPTMRSPVVRYEPIKDGKTYWCNRHKKKCVRIRFVDDESQGPECLGKYEGMKAHTLECDFCGDITIL